MEISVQIEYKNTKLKELREKAGLSQVQLADASGISVRVLQNYEQGVRNLNGAKLITLLRLCRALGCNPVSYTHLVEIRTLLHRIHHSVISDSRQHAHVVSPGEIKDIPR